MLETFNWTIPSTVRYVRTSIPVTVHIVSLHDVDNVKSGSICRANPKGN